jgi:hypothetical protein
MGKETFLDRKNSMKNVKVFYKKNGDCYYKINNDLQRITKLQNNVVSYLDFNTHSVEIISYKSINLSAWKHIENSFFISRHFEWEYNGHKYQTTDKPIKWEKTREYGATALIFHNGKIWSATYSGNYYPRVYLEKKGYVHPSREVLVEKDISNTVEFINKQNSGPNTAKWTDIKYCRNFEKII